MFVTYSNRFDKLNSKCSIILLFYQTNPFTLDRIQAAFIAAISGQVDSSCTTDYTAIPGKAHKKN